MTSPLQAAVQIKHRCTAVHLHTAFVHEKTEKNKTVRMGYVEVFELIGHPGAKNL